MWKSLCLFYIPRRRLSINLRNLNKNYKKRFMSGKLLPGKYKIGLQLEIYMDTEFEVK